MTGIEDNFEWARRLECPASARTNSVKNALNQGLASLLWDQLASALNPAQESQTARKNILLYKIKHGEKDLSIEQIRSKVELKNARTLLIPRYESLEKEYDQKDFEARQKQQQLTRLKALCESVRTREDVLRIKLNQMRTQVANCREMRLVCRYLMPATSCEIDQTIIDDSLSLVSTISTRAERKMAWSKIYEGVSGIEISSLWNVMLSSRTRHTEELMALGNDEIQEETRCLSGENMDIGIARTCGKFVLTAVEKKIHRAKANKHKKSLMDYIEKIESPGANSVDVSEWLALTLEVRKFECEKEILLSEINALKKTLEQQSGLAEERSNVESDILSLDTQVESCVQDIQKSLTLLKAAGSLIVGTKHKITDVLQKIVALRSDNDGAHYLNIDLSTELAIFNDTLQLEAIRKILIKDNVGAYRHTKCCMSEGALAIASTCPSNLSPQFPMLREPIYQLLDCYKHLATKLWLDKIDDKSQKKECLDVGNWSIRTPTERFADCIEVLNATDLACDKVRDEIHHFDSIFDAWNNQSVQKALAVDDSVVNGATFNEWLKRYDTLLYMIKRSK